MPFQLGRPLGAPDDPVFQTRVLKDVLALLESPGPPPVLADFPDDEPENDGITVLACPVNFRRSMDTDDGADELLTAFRREITAMRPWYQTSLNKRQRTTVGVGKTPIEEMADFLYAFVTGVGPEYPDPESPVVYALKYTIEDLKSYYIEGVTAQPGQANASSQVLQDWFWDETVAGQVLLKLKQVCETSEDRMMSMVGAHFIVPGDVARRKQNKE